MSARVLVVDDVPANVKLLEALLMAEYFDVISATNGKDALDMALNQNPDIILLDVMMPGIDGFEVCRQLKARVETRHIPVIMVTALDQQSDRVRGLEAGADDFLSKPVDDVALFARLKSLVRLKMLTDELRLRHETGRSIGIMEGETAEDYRETSGARILVVEDRQLYADKIYNALSQDYDTTIVSEPEQAIGQVGSNDFDLAIVSLSLQNCDGLRLCSQIRSLDEARQLPLVILVEEDDRNLLMRGLEMGVNDYVLRPIDCNELLARVKTQIRNKRYAEKLRTDLEASLELAVIDPLTGLHNRRYLSSHLDNLIKKSAENNHPVSLLILDIDFFKSVNDTYGHDAGDEVLKDFGRRLANNVRGMDLACRIGGEEFVIVMPETDISYAYTVAERIREEVASVPFELSAGRGSITVTISIGVTTAEDPTESSSSLLSRADQALYRAKDEGRNRVVAEAA